MSTKRIIARYWIETAFPLDMAAEVLAGEQSSGTFVKVPGETAELRQRHAARVESITEIDSSARHPFRERERLRALPARPYIAGPRSSCRGRWRILVRRFRI